MNKGFYGTTTKIISDVTSYSHFAEIYTVSSIILIIATIIVTGVDCFFSDLNYIQHHIDLIDILLKFLFFTLFFNLIFSTLILIDQTQKIEILIYPLRFQINDFEEYYGIKDLISEKEINIEVFFLKKGYVTILTNLPLINIIFLISFPSIHFAIFLLSRASFFASSSEISAETLIWSRSFPLT